MQPFYHLDRYFFTNYLVSLLIRRINSKCKIRNHVFSTWIFSLEKFLLFLENEISFAEDPYMISQLKG